jgi:hypothetical protein
MPREKNNEYYQCLGRYVEMKEEAEQLAKDRDTALERLRAQIQITLESKTNGNLACEFDVAGARGLLETVATLNEKLHKAVAAGNFYAPNCDKPQLHVQAGGPSVW